MNSLNRMGERREQGRERIGEAVPKRPRPQPEALQVAVGRRNAASPPVGHRANWAALVSVLPGVLATGLPVGAAAFGNDSEISVRNVRALLVL